MNANQLRPSTDSIMDDDDIIMFKQSELIGSEDITRTLQGYEIESEKKLEANFVKQDTTILDETLGSIIEKSLHFLSNSGENYIKKMYEAESILQDKSTKDPPNAIKKHILGMGLFITSGDNCIYLGIMIVFVSLIIYFMNIVG